MNLQIIGDKSIRKAIGISEEISGKDPENLISSVLQEIISRCGLDDRYLIVRESQLNTLPADLVPFALITDRRPRTEVLSRYQICISRYGEPMDDCESVCHCTTFSVADQGADFAVGNLREMQSGESVFELRGLGITGRIHLLRNSDYVLRAVLVAAATALSCGISFSSVVEVLNEMTWHSVEPECTAV